MKDRNDYNNSCNEIIVEAVELGLAFEVVESAFKHKEQFPDAPFLQCLQVGADFWDI